MGRIYKRPKSKYWWVEYYVNGHQVRESSGSTKEKEAKKLLKKKEALAIEGKLNPLLRAEKLIFDQLAETLLRDYRINGKKSLNRAELSVKNLRKFFGGNMAAINITTDKINLYIEKRQAEGATNATINRELAALKRMFNLSRQAGQVVNIPYIPHLQEDNARTGFFEEYEYRALRDELPDYLKGIFVLAYYTGMRISELRNLKWEQVDLIDRKITLNPEDTKTKEGRIIYLANEPYQFIFMQAQKGQGGCPYVFFNERGKRIGDFRKMWVKACKGAGVDGKLFHDLRRTGVRNMIRAGIDRDVAMRISGHKTDSVFSRYNIVVEKDLRDAAKKMDASTLSSTPRNLTSSKIHDTSTHGPLAQLVEQRTLNP